MRILFRFLLGLTACCVLLFSTARLAAYIEESRRSSSLNENLVNNVVAVREPTTPTAGKETIVVQDQTEESTPTETAPIEVDFDVLLRTNPDVIGWIYCADTPINYPLTQGEDNDYYLYRMIDGTQNSSGTLFVDYRNAGDFSDSNTIVYGHNMKNKEMFGSLPNYKKQSYYDEHPIMWLLTPDASYKVELIAGYVTAPYSEIYSVGQTDDDISVLVNQAIEQSTFKSYFELSEGDRVLTLSTCSYEYDDARYVIFGRLIKIY